MLTAAGGDQNLDCFKLLLQWQADSNKKDWNGNSVLHIAALYGCNKTLEYIARNLKVDIFSRNSSGETALSICQRLRNTAGADTLQKYFDEFDESRNQAKDLLEELTKEEEHDEEAKAKRRLKKWRNKINRIAKQENISPEEVEARLRKEEEDRAREQAEEQRKQEEAERQKELDE